MSDVRCPCLLSKKCSSTGCNQRLSNILVTIVGLQRALLETWNGRKGVPHILDAYSTNPISQKAHETFTILNAVTPSLFFPLKFLCSKYHCSFILTKRSSFQVFFIQLHSGEKLLINYTLPPPKILPSPWDYRVIGLL